MNSAPRTSLERLIRIARGDSGQCRVVANFLLAWWNAAEYGGFDLTDMLAVFEQLLHCRRYPDSLGYGADFEAIVQRWRPASRKSLE
jgi:hypothetical protein